MHDAFGAQSLNGPDADDEKSQKRAQVAAGLLIPCVMLMTVNVFLFLCDALMLTVAPLLRHSDREGGPGSAGPVQPVSHAQVYVFGAAEEQGRTAKDLSQTCVICLSEIEVGERVAHLPCSHIFHSECVTEWLASHGSCPLRCHGFVLPAAGEGSRIPQATWGRTSLEPLPWVVGGVVGVGFGGGGSPPDEEAGTDISAETGISSDSLATERLENELERLDQVFMPLPSAVPLAMEGHRQPLSDEYSTMSDPSSWPDSPSGAERPRNPRQWQVEQRWGLERSRLDS
mmetsp:Transcript_123784/g.396187  ORF Transcript_123784/g.396187 Transcript_123784/m.396187 type:complete len:286 (+) Transcript_123784:993-1850(+)